MLLLGASWQATKNITAVTASIRNGSFFMIFSIVDPKNAQRRPQWPAEGWSGAAGAN